MNGVQITQETARYSDNLLNSFCNFREPFTWNKVSGGANVGSVINASIRTYAGLFSIGIPFIGTGECVFNAGGSQMEKLIPKGGLYLLSYRFFKSNDDAEIVVKVQMYINGNLFPQNEIIQTLSTENGFVNGEWNTFFQQVTLNDDDVVDFAFSVQSDTASGNLYIDGLKLELNDRNLNVPSVYSETPIEPITETTQPIDIPAILEGGSVVVDFVVVDAKVDDYVVMKYPSEIIDEGLLVGTPTLTADGVGKFFIFNPTLVVSPVINDAIFKFKVVK